MERKILRKGIYGLLLSFMLVLTMGLGFAQAGSLEPSGAPGPTMKTLDEIPPAWSQTLRADDGDPVTGCGSSRFECVMDGEAVLDKETGLVWEQSPETTRSNWGQAFVRCQSIQTGGRMGWRLPRIEELASLMALRLSGMALPAGHPFRNIDANNYWSATTSPIDSSVARMMIVVGLVDQVPASKSSLQGVWCVRGGQGYDRR